MHKIIHLYSWTAGVFSLCIHVSDYIYGMNYRFLCKLSTETQKLKVLILEPLSPLKPLRQSVLL